MIQKTLAAPGLQWHPGGQYGRCCIIHDRTYSRGGGVIGDQGPVTRAIPDTASRRSSSSPTHPSPPSCGRAGTAGPATGAEIDTATRSSSASESQSEIGSSTSRRLGVTANNSGPAARAGLDTATWSPSAACRDQSSKQDQSAPWNSRVLATSVGTNGRGGGNIHERRARRKATVKTKYGALPIHLF